MQNLKKIKDINMFHTETTLLGTGTEKDCVGHQYALLSRKKIQSNQSKPIFFRYPVFPFSFIQNSKQ